VIQSLGDVKAKKRRNGVSNQFVTIRSANNIIFGVPFDDKLEVIREGLDSGAFANREPPLGKAGRDLSLVFPTILSGKPSEFDIAVMLGSDRRPLPVQINLGLSLAMFPVPLAL
jgi:hypothetical protein